ncbi:hypothetical protein SBA_pBAR3_0860 (plasmid) [Sphingomonas bisphenolicum]|uniref:Uncharacterized protein n=1 Tax=Sphingomonas bisphenolicum TaxID=296544 RepID=A0ABN5WJR5_9SPHN|nr:hypothetical protein SBA_pBAR3_0860 [Sphingomonas bisphenolicum]
MVSPASFRKTKAPEGTSATDTPTDICCNAARIPEAAVSFKTPNPSKPYGMA